MAVGVTGAAMVATGVVVTVFGVAEVTVVVRQRASWIETGGEPVSHEY